jgi:ABC-2 type transport system permease protein
MIPIIRKELHGYFHTWMAYIIAAVSLFISGLLFNSYAIGPSPDFSMVVLSRFFYFASGVGMITAVALAMRLVAEESQTGTVVLLFTSPVSEREVIYGKFFAALLFFVFLQLISVYMPALILLRGKISFGHVMTGYLGITLLGSAVLALTLFASSLATNQLISVVLSALFVVFLLLLWQMAEVVDEPFKGFYDYVSLHHRRFQGFRDGIIHLRDVVYYVGLSVLGLEAAAGVFKVKRISG